MKHKTPPFLTLLFLIFLSSCTDVKFDTEKWKNWEISEWESHMRWDMVNDLIDNYNLEGKTQEEIINLLGKPDNWEENPQERFYYDLGPCRRGIDFGSLDIEFENGKVVNIKKSCS